MICQCSGILVLGGRPGAFSADMRGLYHEAVLHAHRARPFASKVMSHDPHSKNRLGPGAAEHFTTDSLFDRIARAVCRADCLPRKELYESWEVARRTRRRLRGGRTVDLACGHGLVAHIMTILDPSSEGAIGIDRRVPASAERILASLVEDWPFLRDRVQLVPGEIESAEIFGDDVVVSAHACGSLTDLVIDRAVAVGARVAVLPCCHDHDRARETGLEGWLDASLAIDVDRAQRLKRAGYTVYTQTIPRAITPKNRLLLAELERRDLGQSSVP